MKVFIISTPSQAFFLLKSKNYVDKGSLLIILKNGFDNEAKILKYLNILNWKDILIWDIEGVDSYKNYYKFFLFNRNLISFKSKYGSPSKIFMGSYDNLFQLSFVAKFEETAELFLLYDGLQMISVSNIRKSEKNKGIRSFSWIFKIAQLNSPNIKKLTFISPLPISVNEKDEVIRLLKVDTSHPNLDMNLVYIVGQPLVDIGIIDVKDFLSMLSKISLDFGNSNIKYLPHPKESEKIKALINDYFDILNFNDIFEEYYLGCELFAGNIVSFYSSVLVNMNSLSYPGKLISYKINLNDVQRTSFSENIMNVYSYFEQINNPNFTIRKFN